MLFTPEMEVGRQASRPRVTRYTDRQTGQDRTTAGREEGRKEELKESKSMLLTSERERERERGKKE